MFNFSQSFDVRVGELDLCSARRDPVADCTNRNRDMIGLRPSGRFQARPVDPWYGRTGMLAQPSRV
jgi:hypothetical protein